MSLTEDAAVVEFVDFGNSDKVPFSNIRVINQDLLEIPLVCVRCRLAVVDVSCEQEDLAIKYLSDKLLDTTFLVTVESVEEDKETFIGNVSPTDNTISDVFTQLSNLRDNVEAVASKIVSKSSEHIPVENGLEDVADDVMVNGQS